MFFFIVYWFINAINLTYFRHRKGSGNRQVGGRGVDILVQQGWKLDEVTMDILVQIGWKLHEVTIDILLQLCKNQRGNDGHHCPARTYTWWGNDGYFCLARTYTWWGSIPVRMTVNSKYFILEKRHPFFIYRRTICVKVYWFIHWWKMLKMYFKFFSKLFTNFLGSF